MTPPNYTLFLTISVFLVIFVGFPPAVFVTTVIEWFPDLYEKTKNVFQGYSIMANLGFALVSGYVILASSVPNHASAGQYISQVATNWVGSFLICYFKVPKEFVWSFLTLCWYRVLASPIYL